MTLDPLVRAALVAETSRRLAPEALADKLREAQTPGLIVTFEKHEADAAGAFAEDALSESDALDSTPDLPAALDAIGA